MISDTELEKEIIATYSGDFCNKEVVRLALQELKQRRECELRPATKYLGNTLGEQLTKIHQEFKEVESELKYKSFNKETAVEELVDLQTTCETMLAILGLDDADRADARRRVIAKNKARGYYDEHA